MFGPTLNHLRPSYEGSLTTTGPWIFYDHTERGHLKPIDVGQRTLDEGSPTTTSLCFRLARRRRATNTGRGARLHRGGPHDRTASIARQPTRAYAVSAGRGEDLRNIVYHGTILYHLRWTLISLLRASLKSLSVPRYANNDMHTSIYGKTKLTGYASKRDDVHKQKLSAGCELLT